MKQFLIKLALGIFLCTAALSVRAELVNGIIAIVGEAIITYEDVQNELVTYLPSLRAKYAAQPQVFNQKMKDLQRERIEILVERRLILNDFKTAGYNLPESFIEDIIKDRIRERYGDRLTLIKGLQKEGTTYESYRQSVRDQFIVEQMRFKNVAGEIMVSPYKIETFYEQNIEQYKLGDEVKLRMIVLDKAKHDTGLAELATEIRTKLKAGADFAEMAKVYSDGSQSSQGGDWGWVEKAVLREDLAAAAFALKPGELSDVLEKKEAFYLMLVEETRPAHVKPLTEVRDEVEKNLIGRERARLEKKWIDRLKIKQFVRYFPEAQ